MEDTVWSARRFAQWHFGTDEPSPTQMNSVTKMCRDGTIRNASKVGREWHINCTREWPELFPPKGGRETDPMLALAELLESMARQIRGGVDGREESGAA